VATLVPEKDGERPQKRPRRRPFYVANYKGLDVMRAMPAKRGGNKPGPSEAWKLDFACNARWSKKPDVEAFNMANQYADGQTFFWRDIILMGLSGTLYFEGADVKIVTPTARATRLGNLSPAQSQDVAVPITAVTWDNNAFWDPNSHPERVTFRVDGLYLLTALVKYTSGTTAYRESRIVNQDGLILDNNEDQKSSGFGTSQRLLAIYYFYAGQWAKVTTNPGASGQTVQLWDFTVIAITPEAII